MHKSPLIYLAFANDEDAYLHMLEQERDAISEELAEIKRKEYVQCIVQEKATVQKITEACVEHRETMTIFHYAGHADGKHLQLEGGDGNAEGLATMLAQLPNLKLVFLNGCATKGQVETLMDAGVKSVLATNVKINDRKAKQFATHFYDALANRHTLAQAFNLAKGFLQAEYSEDQGLSVQNAVVVLKRKDEPPSATIPWGLYVQEEHRAQILKYRIRHYQPMGLSPELKEYIKREGKVNQRLLTLLDQILKYNPDVNHELVEMRDGQQVKKDSNEYPDIIIKNYPWVIGAQIRLLKIYEKEDLIRLEHLISTYVFATQFVYYLLLSDLWNQNRNMTDSVKYKVISKSKDEYVKFDFLGEVPDLCEKVEQVGDLFVAELDDLAVALKDPENILSKAHRHMEKVRSDFLAGTIAEQDIVPICQLTEKVTAVILQQLAFLSGYKVLTIRQVQINRPRFQELEYELDMGSLNATEGSALKMYTDAGSRTKSNYADSDSIVLVGSENKLGHALNLSPFIIDKNTFVQVKKSETTEQDKLADIFMLGWEEEGRLHFVRLQHSFFSAINLSQDQVHTDMTLDDFLEGRNISQKNAFDDFGDEFDAALGLDPDNAEDTSPKVFELLKSQYDMLKIDLEP